MAFFFIDFMEPPEWKQIQNPARIIIKKSFKYSLQIIAPKPGAVKEKGVYENAGAKLRGSRRLAAWFDGFAAPFDRYINPH